MRFARVDQVGLQIERGGALLGGRLQAFQRRAEAPQQGIDGERHDAQHHDLAHGIEGTEIDQHHVHHVGAAAFGQCAFQEERRNAVGGGACHQRIGQAGKSQSGQYRQHQVAATAQAGAQRSAVAQRLALGHPAQAEQEQDGGDDLDC